MDIQAVLQIEKTDGGKMFSIISHIADILALQQITAKHFG